MKTVHPAAAGDSLLLLPEASAEGTSPAAKGSGAIAHGAVSPGDLLHELDPGQQMPATRKDGCWKEEPSTPPSSSLLERSHILEELIRRANSSWELTARNSIASAPPMPFLLSRHSTSSSHKPSSTSSPAEANGGSWFHTWPERGKLEERERMVESPGLEKRETREISQGGRERAGSDPLPANGTRRKSIPLSELLHCLPLAYSPQTRQLTLLPEESPSSSLGRNEGPLSAASEDSSREGKGEEDLSPSVSLSFSQSRPGSPSLLSLQSDVFGENQGQEQPQKRSIAAFLKRALLPWRLGREPHLPDGRSKGDVWHLFNHGKSKEEASSEASGLLASSMGLILEERPPPLPPKPPHEHQKHQQQHADMLARARKKELQEVNKRQKQQQQRLKEEEHMALSARTWTLEILPHWESLKHSRKVRELWWQGLPPCIRGRVWKLAIGNELNITPEFYRFLVLRAEEKLHISESENTSLESFGGDSEQLPRNNSASTNGEGLESTPELIRMDVSRTFPQLGIFQKGGPYHELLRRVLGAYACMRPDVGYVQGMSFLAAVLLLNLEEEEAFAAFANLLNRPLQQTLFRMDQPVMHIYYSAFEEVLETHLPNLHSHLRQLGLSPDLYLPDWLYTIFARSLPLDLACRVWDVFLRDGDPFLFRTALGLLRMLESELSQLDFIQGAQILNKLPEDLNAERLFRIIRRLHLKDLALPSSPSFACQSSQQR